MSEPNTGQRNEPQDAGASVSRHPSAPEAAPGDGPALPPPWPRALRWPLSLLLGLSFGVAFGLHTVFNHLPWLAYVSTVPWLLLCLHPRVHGRFNLFSLAVGLQVLCMVGVYWLRGKNNATWIGGPFLYWPVFLVTWPLCRGIVARWPRFPTALLWPLVFTGAEWLRIRLCPGELSLFHLAYSQIRRTRICQVADLGGAAFVSFYLAAVAGFVGALILSRTLFADSRSRRRWLAPQLAFVVLLSIFVQAYGAVRDTEANFHDGPTVQIVQTDTKRSREDEVIAKILDWQILQTLSTVRPGEADVVLWPENSLFTAIRTEKGWDRRYLADLQRVVDRAQAPLVFDSAWTTDEGLHYHTAYMLQPDGELQHHWKVRLLPWTEYPPLTGFFGLFGEGALEWWTGIIRAVVGFVPNGSEAPIDTLHPMTLTARDGKTYTFGTPICFEIATARVVNRWHRFGVDFLFNPTSEGQLGDTVHTYTLAVSGFRAIEGRVPVVRASNDGISGIVDANGRMAATLLGRYTGSPINEPGVLFATIPLDSRGPTLYSRIGDCLPIGCLLAAAALALAGFVRSRSRRRSAPAA